MNNKQAQLNQIEWEIIHLIQKENRLTQKLRENSLGKINRVKQKMLFSKITKRIAILEKKKKDLCGG